MFKIAWAPSNPTTRLPCRRLEGLVTQVAHAIVPVVVIVPPVIGLVVAMLVTVPLPPPPPDMLVHVFVAEQ